ncbi:RNA-binding domain-containing protein, partial [Wallemia mellicola CBS 633.66]
MNTPGAGIGASGRDGRTHLFVGNLPYRVRWQDLKDLFRKAGTVLRADVALGLDNRSKGYGNVLMGSEIDAAKAIELYNGYVWQTRTLEVRPDRLPPEYDLPGPQSQPHNQTIRPARTLRALGSSPPANLATASTPSLTNRNIFVGNLPYNMQWQELKDTFRAAGNVIRAEVATNHDGTSKGYGIITFADESEAIQGVQMFDG